MSSSKPISPPTRTSPFKLAPPEVWTHIARYVGVSDLVALRGTCLGLKNVVDSNNDLVDTVMGSPVGHRVLQTLQQPLTGHAHDLSPKHWAKEVAKRTPAFGSHSVRQGLKQLLPPLEKALKGDAGEWLQLIETQNGKFFPDATSELVCRATHDFNVLRAEHHALVDTQGYCEALAGDDSAQGVQALACLLKRSDVLLTPKQIDALASSLVDYVTTAAENPETNIRHLYPALVCLSTLALAPFATAAARRHIWQALLLPGQRFEALGRFRVLNPVCVDTYRQRPGLCREIVQVLLPDHGVPLVEAARRFAAACAFIVSDAFACGQEEGAALLDAVADCAKTHRFAMPTPLMGLIVEALLGTEHTPGKLPAHVQKLAQQMRERLCVARQMLPLAVTCSGGSIDAASLYRDLLASDRVPRLSGEVLKTWVDTFRKRLDDPNTTVDEALDGVPRMRSWPTALQDYLVKNSILAVKRGVFKKLRR